MLVGVIEKVSLHAVSAEVNDRSSKRQMSARHVPSIRGPVEMLARGNKPTPTIDNEEQLVTFQTHAHGVTGEALRVGDQDMTARIITECGR